MNSLVNPSSEDQTTGYERPCDGGNEAGLSATDSHRSRNGCCDAKRIQSVMNERKHAVFTEFYTLHRCSMQFKHQMKSNGTNRGFSAVQKTAILTMVPLWGLLVKSAWADLSFVPLGVVLVCLVREGRR